MNVGQPPSAVRADDSRGGCPTEERLLKLFFRSSKPLACGPGRRVLTTIPFNMGNRQKQGLFEKNRGRELRKTEPDCKKPRKIGHSCMLRGLDLRAYPVIFSRNSRYLKSTEPSGTKRRPSGQASPSFTPGIPGIRCKGMYRNRCSDELIAKMPAPLRSQRESRFSPGLTHHFSLGFLGFLWKIQDIHMMLRK